MKEKNEENKEQKEKWSLKKWLSDHKKPLVAVGATIGAVIIAVVLQRESEPNNNLSDFLDDLDDKNFDFNEKYDYESDYSIDYDSDNHETGIEMSFPFDVSSHIRNLPNGWEASAEKIAMAVEMGFELKPGQTWVESYVKGGDAA